VKQSIKNNIEEDSDEEDREILKRLIKVRYLVDYVSRKTSRHQAELDVFEKALTSSDSLSKSLHEFLSTSQPPIKVDDVQIDLRNDSITEGIRKMIYEIFQLAREMKSKVSESDRLFLKFQKLLQSKFLENETLLKQKEVQLMNLKNKVCQCIKNQNDPNDKCTCSEKQARLMRELELLKSEKNALASDINTVKDTLNLLVQEHDTIQSDLTSNQVMVEQKLTLKSFNTNAEFLSSMLSENGILKAKISLQNELLQRVSKTKPNPFSEKLLNLYKKNQELASKNVECVKVFFIT
jgi:hypothetical protein